MSSSREVARADQWARGPWAELARRGVQRVALGPLLRSAVTVEARGCAELAELDGPMVIVANHASHLDTPVLLSALPPKVRNRLVVGAAGGALFESAWRRGLSALVFNAALLDTRPGYHGAHDAKSGHSGQSGHGGSADLMRTGERVSADDLLDDGWSLLIYPEGSRSVDGFLGRFADLAAELAIRHQVPVVPAGIRGTYAVMPRGRRWPLRLGGESRQRSRVSVGFGNPLRPAPDADVSRVATEIVRGVKQLIDEDATTWWQTQRHPRDSGEQPDPPLGSWRRIWQETQPPGKGGQSPRPRIWSS